MTEELASLSDSFATIVASAAPVVIGLRAGGHRHGSAVLWRDGVAVTSEQALPEADAYTAVLPGGAQAKAVLAGRDRGTNVAALRIDGAGAAQPTRVEVGAVGALALVLGSDGAGACTARLGMVHRLGPAWHSMAGGKIDRLIVLDSRIGGAEEGGPVLDARGGLLGISTLGPRRRALVIPHATIARVLDPLLAEGRVARGWLGVAVQPVALPQAQHPAAGSEAGLMVMGLSAGGPAEQAGVLQGDILLSLDGVTLSSPRGLSELLGPDRVGRACSLRVLRAGAAQDIRVTVGARP